MSTNGSNGKKTTRIEPSERWVRAQVGGKFVVDSKRPILVWEHEYYPTYFFPQKDVRMDLMGEPIQTKSRTFWNLTVDGRTVERAAYARNLPELAGYVTLYWNKMDHWFEEAEEVFVHARDPHKRVDTILSTRHVRVEIDGVTVADSKRPSLLFETHLPTRYYLPAEDVRMDLLTPSETHTSCPYKGVASYWEVTVGGKEYKDIVWSYPDPIPEAPKIKDLLCFYNEKVDIYVDGVLQERPVSPFS